MYVEHSQAPALMDIKEKVATTVQNDVRAAMEREELQSSSEEDTARSLDKKAACC